MSNTPTTESREATLTKIAREVLGLETLETRGSDALDFHDVATWTIAKALERAYEAGRKAGR